MSEPSKNPKQNVKKRKRNSENRNKAHPTKKRKLVSHSTNKSEHPYEKEVNAKKPKYKRGRKQNVRRIQHPRLRNELKKEEEIIKNNVEHLVRSEILHPEEQGLLESTDPLIQTWKFQQKQIKEAVNVRVADKIFDLDLNEFGPYNIHFSRNGRYLLLAGEKGHVTSIDWFNNEIHNETFLNETVRDACYLHNETVYAVAQKRYVYVYDKSGVELRCMKNHIYAQRLEFLPYHFLLASINKNGILCYQDTTNGEMINTIRTKLGFCNTMTQNPYNAIINLGHQNGTVTLWTPTMQEPIVKMLTHRGPVKDIAIDNEGRTMITCCNDGTMKIWDLRTYKLLQDYFFQRPVESLHISQTNKLATATRTHIKIWKDYTLNKAKEPYMMHDTKNNRHVSRIRFCPFEDVLGIGHKRGYSSIVVPGSGEANIDTFEANPFESRKQRTERTVRRALEKIPADMISLDPTFVGSVTYLDVDEYRKDLRRNT